MHTTTVVLGVGLLLRLSSMSLARRIPVEVHYGWGTEIQRLATVPGDADLAAGFQGSTVHVSYKWDQLSLVFPFWIANGGYIIEVVSNDAPRQYFELKDQEPESIADLAGIAPDLISRPLFSRFPFGYVVVFVAYAIAKVTSGPSPKKRFAGLIRDTRYQNALGLLAGRQTELMASESNSVASATIGEKMNESYSEAIQLLVEQGVSRSKANRNLQFLLGYLQKNPHDARALAST